MPSYMRIGVSMVLQLQVLKSSLEATKLYVFIQVRSRSLCLGLATGNSSMLALLPPKNSGTYLLTCNDVYEINTKKYSNVIDIYDKYIYTTNPGSYFSALVKILSPKTQNFE